MSQIKIAHEGIEGFGYATDESLPVWLELGWEVVEEEVETPPAHETLFVTHIEGKEETLVELEDEEEAVVEPQDEEETPLPDQKESDQDDVDAEEF